MMRRTALLLLFLLVSTRAGAFETNGKVWPDMPVQYWVNPAECPEVATEDGPLDIVMVAAMATQAWGGVACADVSFQFMGTTDATWDADGKNVIYCVSNPEDWAFGVGAAGATLWIPQQDASDPMEVDLALNAAELQWQHGGGTALEADVIDPQALITHELGHWLGLTHTPDPFATMYFATLPNAMQNTLAADDKAGLCSLYPSGYEECESDADCLGDWYCKPLQGIPVCHEPHDGAGGFCSKDYINCDEMCWVSFFECQQLCLFTTMSYDEGYCAPLCGEGHEDCPDGTLCTEVEEHDISVCMEDPDYVPPDLGPEATMEYEEVLVQPEFLEVVTGDLASETVAAHDLRSMETLASDDVPDALAEVMTPADVSALPEPEKTSGGCAATQRNHVASGFLLLAWALLALAFARRRTC
jgi:hypothetical protein